ncbi:MAG: hypothetical protein V4592_08170 [Bacteroidota bacterium]
MSEEEYRDLVLADFDRKVKAGLLPELTASTRSSIKAQCISVCMERYHRKDEPLLSALFGRRENQAAYLAVIRNISAEDFRTLNNFLNDREIQTSFRNIRLLAWLADFEPRPYHYELELPLPILGDPVTGDEAADTVIDTPLLPREPIIGEKNKAVVDPPEGITGRGARKKVLWLVLLLMVLGAGGYYWFGQGAATTDGAELLKPRVLATGGDSKCMYWDGDHFNAVAYQLLPAGKVAYRLDSADLRQFKRVMKPKALLISDTSHIWYFKVSRDSIECFTAAGFHPVLADRLLKRLTGYMYKKYLNKGQQKVASQ